MKLTNLELTEIQGGATSITGTLINSVVKVVSVVADLGKAVGSAIRRIGTGNLCPF